MRSHSSLPAALALLLAACGGDSTSDTDPAPRVVDCPSARIVTGPADLVPGPLARGRNGDLVLENTRLRAIVQKGGRNWFSIAAFGGNIIDAVPKDAAGRLAAEDHYEEAALGTNVESSPNYQTVEVIEPGGRDEQGNCQAAVIRATGPDDLLDFVNGSSAIRDMGFMYPDSADDVDLPITVATDYTLEPDASHITMATRLINESDSALDIYMVEYLNGSGEVELFQYGYGFGEPLVTAPCDSCRAAIYAGHEGGSGVSYGIIHDFAGTSSVSVSGVTVLVYASDALPLFAAGETLEPQPFTVPASGELTVTRWFAVGDGDVASILDIQHQILDQSTGRLSGVVSDANGPVAGAEIAVISSENDFERLPVGLPLPTGDVLPPLLRGPDTIVANHFRTDAQGRYAGTLPPGSYELRLNAPGRAAGEPSTVSIDVAAGADLTQDFTVPAAARLRVRVLDENDEPIAAKVQLIGTDTSPDAGEPQNSESVLLGLLTVNTGIFGDTNADKLPPGVVLSEFAVNDPGSGAVGVGDTGFLETEPGDFQLSVSRGPRYSEFVRNVQLAAGATTEVTARIARVVDTPGYVYGDFHVHSFNSPDAEVTNRERLATYLAEDMDFITPSDHGMRVDFEPVIAEMGVADLIASAPSAEITSFDYGHFNAWPVAIETISPRFELPGQSGDPKTSRGANDWGGAAPVGQDFPSAGHFSLTPGEIFADAKADPLTPQREVVVQINHVDSHFGAAGLGIDTGVNPPQSSTDPTSRRLPPESGNLFSDGFDSLELWIGVDGRAHQFTHFLGENMGDWFNLLNQGILKTFVANSDTHDRRLTSLSTRNLISVPDALDEDGHADPALLREDPHAVGDAVRAGYTTGTNALFMQVSATNAAGERASLEQGDDFGVRSHPLPLASADEDLQLQVSIQAPLWAEYDQVAIYTNAATTRQQDENGEDIEPPRYALCPPAQSAELDEGDFTRHQVPAVTLETQTFARYESEVTFTMSNPGQDYWVVVLAQGRDGISRPLWPVVPNDFAEGDGDLRNRTTDDIGVVAMAVSNPLYIDADGDGQWTAPGLNISEDCNGGGGLGLPDLGLPGLPSLPLVHRH